jgi:hypothetical protein
LLVFTGLFDEFDDDGSGTIDDVEWEKFAAVLKVRAAQDWPQLLEGGNAAVDRQLVVAGAGKGCAWAP